MRSPRSGVAGPPHPRTRPRAAARYRRSRPQASSSLSPRWKSRAILQNLFERSATGIRFQNGVLHGAGITIYQEGRIASFCESRDVLGTAMEPPLAVPQDGLVPGHVPRPPRDHRLVPARLYGGRARLSWLFFFAPPRGSLSPPPLRARGCEGRPPRPPPAPRTP